MYVNQIWLRNVRQFEERRFSFRPGFNLIVGENGAGKTTVLKALYGALGGNYSDVREKARITKSDIRLRSRHLQIKADVTDSPGEFSSYLLDLKWGNKIQRKGNKHSEVLFYASNEAICKSFIPKKVRRQKGEDSEEFYREDFYHERWLYDREMYERHSGKGRRYSGFGATGEVREFVSSVLERFSPKYREFYWRFEPYACVIKPPAESPNDPFFAAARKALSEEIMRLLQERSHKETWPHQATVAYNARGYPEIERGSKRLLHLPPIQHFVKSRELDKSLPYLEQCKIEIRLTPRIHISAANGFLSIDQLSDGEARLFSLFVDIARRLSLQAEDRWFADRCGIVLIDEIDVHLHPKWQRMIVPSLEKLFPNCQFIATTHSPFVVQSLNEGQVQHLDKEILGVFTDRGIEEIAVKVMGIHDHQVSVRYLEMLDVAKSYFRKLEAASNQPGDSPDIVALRESLSGLSHRYAFNPAYQAYLELQTELTFNRLPPNEAR